MAKNKIIDFLLCLFFGYLGIHKFYEKKNGLGILYLFTIGLCGFGWLIDIFILFIKLFKKEPKPIEYEEKQYNFQIINTNQKALKKIYSSKYSIEDVYLSTYKDGTAIKVILTENDDILGDIKPEDVEKVLKANIENAEIYVDHKLNNDGEMEYLGEVYKKIKIQKISN